MDGKQSEANSTESPPPPYDMYQPPETAPMTGMQTKPDGNPPAYSAVPPVYTDQGQGVHPPTGGYPAQPGYPAQGYPTQGYPSQPGYMSPGGYPVTQQPMYGPGSAPVVVCVAPNAMLTNPPPTNLGLAIFATLCCCWPVGLFAILRSSSCKNAIMRGDEPEAVRLSQQSKKLSMWAVGIGLVFNIMFFIAILMGMLA